MKDEANYVIKIYTNSTIKLLSQAHAQKTSSWKDLSFQELDLWLHNAGCGQNFFPFKKKNNFFFNW